MRPTSPQESHGSGAPGSVNQRLRRLGPSLVAAIGVFLPFAVMTAVLAVHGTGFLVQDDWNVYVTSFDWLMRGDLSVLWASVSEHRVVLSRLLHFLEYAVVGDSRALLYFSLALQLIFAFTVLRRLSADYPFSADVQGALLRVAAWFFVSALLFSPIQAWAFARTAYLEIFTLNFGSLVFLLGLTRWKLGWTIAGLLVAVCSTPGWLALVPTALLFFAYSMLVARDAPPLRRQLRFAIPLLLTAGLLAVAYVFPFDHPNNSGASHRPMSVLLLELVSNPLASLGQYLAFLGFPVCVVGTTAPLSDVVTPSDILRASRVFGVVYLAFAGLLVVLRWRSRRSLDLATSYVLFSVVLSFAITLARKPILGDLAVVNYAYSAYTVPGWAFAAYLWFRWFDEGALSKLAVARNLAAASALALLLVATGYQRGRVALIGTLHGQKYLLSLYVDNFLSPSSEEARWESARVLDHPDPGEVFEGTAILKELDLVPRNWHR